MYNMFAYLPIFNWPDGSSYKYYVLLQAHFGGITLKSKKQVSTPGDFSEDLQRLKPDIAFCHGDWMNYWVVPQSQGIPYILFEHDVHSLRTGLNTKQRNAEKAMLEGAAGIMFTSPDHQNYCNDNYQLTKHQGLVYLRPLKKDLAFSPLPKLPGKHLVYAGGIINTTGSNYGYRAYRQIFTDFIDAGWTVHVYGNHTQAETLKEYSKFGCVPHTWVPYWALLKEMSQYTAGLQAYTKEGVNTKAFEYTQTCRPNKTWDYLAAGIPTIGLNAGNCAKIYQEGGWGITIPDTERKTLENIELPSFPESLRFEHTMDGDISVFNRVIKGVLKTGNTKIEFKEGVEEQDMDNRWYRLEKPVVENGRLLHGRGKRIPMTEAIRLGLVKKEVLVKEKLVKRSEEKKAKIEVKPLVDPKEAKDKKGLIQNFAKELEAVNTAKKLEKPVPLHVEKNQKERSE
jgi:hypothetical protein